MKKALLRLEDIGPGSYYNSKDNLIKLTYLSYNYINII